MTQFTKILATIGPATLAKKQIGELIKSGADGFRINTAHGDFEQYERIIRNVRAHGSYPIMLDIKGPELRLQTEEPLLVKRGEEKYISFAKSHCSFSNHFKGDMQVGDDILFDDGKVRGRIIKLTRSGITIRFMEPGTIEPHKTVAIPKRKIELPPLSTKDRKAIRLAKKYRLAFIALSFTRSAEDVVRVQRLLKDSGVVVIAKIENTQGVENAGAILDKAEGIMIARGDLGVEILQENLPAVQKRLLRLCNEKGKIGIVATQVLESMVHRPRQTRAETSDVANAILDGADALMLSEETAIGEYPKKCIQVINKISRATEQEFAISSYTPPSKNLSQAMTSAAATLAQRTNVDKIIALTKSGYTARQLARYRLRTPIIAVTPHLQVKEQLMLTYGVDPILMEGMPAHGRVPFLTEKLYKLKILAKSHRVLYMAGVHTIKENVSNLLQLNTVESVLEYDRAQKS